MLGSAGAAGAALAATLLTALALLSVIAVLAWIRRRIRQARQGPVAPLSWRSSLLLCIALAYPAMVATLWINIWLQQRGQDALDANLQARRYVTVQAASTFGEITLPAGTRLLRDDPLDPGTPDWPVTLRAVQAMRFPAPQAINAAWVSAVQTAPPLMELAQPRRFTVQAEGPSQGREMLCDTGWIAQFRLPDDQRYREDWQRNGLPPESFQPSRWLFETCFEGSPILVPTLRNGEIAWE